MGYPAPQKFYGVDEYGRPLAGGLLYTYEAGTSTPLETYADADLSTENSNPVVLDAGGRASVFIPGGTPYKFVLKTSAGVTVYTEDEIEVPAFVASAPAEGLPPGTIAGYGGAVAPAGWVLCDGAAYLRASPTYAALFAAIGILHGPGNGSTTFNVPNAVGRFLLMKAASGTGSVLGASGGALDHTHSVPVHTHPIAAHNHITPAHTHPVPRDGYGSVENSPPVTSRMQTGGSGAGSEASTTQATQDAVSGASAAIPTTDNTAGLVTGNNTAANTGTANPPFYVVNVIIKL
jgi:microcystin-dependent protein